MSEIFNIANVSPIVHHSGQRYLALSKPENSLWNLPDYEEAIQKTSWNQLETDLKLPRKNGFNLGTICIDEHPEEVMQRPALLWQGTDGSKKHFTFTDLQQQTNQFANVLQNLGIQPGQRIFIYLERIPELYITIFGALKAQVIVGPLFSAFGPEAIEDRLLDSQATLIVTSPALQPRLESILDSLPDLKTIITVQPPSQPNDKSSVTDASSPVKKLDYHTLMAMASTEFEVSYTAPETLSIIHYTSGTTGKPKGAVHCHQSVVAQAATAKWVLDLKPETDVYWCTADPGWVTGTSYGMIGPWALGTTVFVYEGGFDADTWYQLIETYGITVWYTAPTAIRMLMKAGNARLQKVNLSCLRHLASVGEPLNPEAIIWGQEVFGHIFHDTWWQTETGAMHITNFGCLDVKPGSMGKPVPGVVAAVLDDNWNPLPADEEGHLALRPLAPSMFRTYWGKEDVYQSKFKNGWYITGDRAWVDEDGYFWFVGREDDVINTAGHLVGPFEVESALIEHPAVAEAGVIGKPDPERMEIIKAFVSLKQGFVASEDLKQDIQRFVRNRLAAHAYPREIDFIDGLPKTRSGKIMRRLLKARELGLAEGDTSTLEE